MFLLLLTACSQKPRPIHLQSDECAHCKMMITDLRFAAQIITSKGKAIKFDAIECMATYYEAMEEDGKSNAKLWVSDFNDSGQWISIENAVFVKSDVIQSPMGESLLALHSQTEAKEHIEKYQGEIISWNEIIDN